MSALIPDVGREYIATVLDDETFEIAVGSGTSTPTANDTALDNELYRAAETDPNVDVTNTSTAGELKFSIAISGGTEVAAGTDITEFGAFGQSGELLYRDTTSTTTVAAGEHISFTFTVTVTN